MVGDYRGALTFDGQGGGPASVSGSTDILVLRYGSVMLPLEWSQPFGGAGEDGALAVAADSAGNVIVTGMYEQMVTIDPRELPDAMTHSDILVMKLEPMNGDVLWAHGLVDETDEGDAAGTAVAVDGAGNVLVTGVMYGRTHFREDGTHELVSGGGADVFVAKFRPDAARASRRAAGNRSHRSRSP